MTRIEDSFELAGFSETIFPRQNIEYDIRGMKHLRNGSAMDHLNSLYIGRIGGGQRYGIDGLVGVSKAAQAKQPINLHTGWRGLWRWRRRRPHRRNNQSIYTSGGRAYGASVAKIKQLILVKFLR